MHGVVQRRYIIQGDNITVGDKAKLEKAMQAFDLIERYAFTYTNKENSKGAVRLYSKGSESKAYDFEIEHVLLSEEDAIILIGNYKLRDYYRITIQVTALIVKEPTNNTKLVLSINGITLIEWFKQLLRDRSKQDITKSKGIKR